jgi:hypothetical protein
MGDLLLDQRIFQKEEAGWVMQGELEGAERPPRMRSNAPQALQGKDCGERSEDFWAAQQRKSNGIFKGCQKRPTGLF